MGAVRPERRAQLRAATSLGDSSTNLQHITPGTWIIAEGPYGAMIAARRTRADVVLIAGGVGITPMRALFETIPVASHQHLTLLYRARNADPVLFRRGRSRDTWRRI